MTNNLRACREAVGLLQHELAKKLGSDQGRISHYEKGRRTPDLKTCRAIVAALNENGGNYSIDDVFPPDAGGCLQDDPSPAAA